MAVTVSIVNYNHAHYLAACLDAVLAQTSRPEQIVIIDNASCDGSVEFLRKLDRDVVVRINSVNRGYAGGHNQVFSMAQTDYVLALNCDVILDVDFLSEMVKVLERLPRVGSACGRLYRGSKGQNGTLDSTGLFPDRYRRFQDRVQFAGDLGTQAPPSYVFGPSGSAALYRKAMLDDLSLGGQVFDEDFFAYCEDADLAWRAQRLGWSAVFVPSAVGWHVHDDMSRARSIKSTADATFRQLLLTRNRHLCALKNDTVGEVARDFPWLIGYELALEAYLILRKPNLALRWPVQVLRAMSSIIEKRSALFRRSRRQVKLSDWFDTDRDRSVLI